MEAEEKKQESWDWLKHKPNNMLKVTCRPDMNFFKWWCTILHPFVPLTPKETDVVASYLRIRYKLAKVISDPSILDSQLMSKDTTDKVIEECGMTLQHYYVVMSGLRKKGVITSSGIHSRLIPNTRDIDNGYFQLLILLEEDMKDDV